MAKKFDKNEKLLVKYEYDYSSNNNQQLRNLCCSSLTVKHRIVDIAMKNIPVAAELLFARKNSVSGPRHYDVRRASQARLGWAWHAGVAGVIKE